MLDNPTIMIRLAEVSTKGQNRKEFVKILKKNIMVATTDCGIISMKQTYDRLYIQTQPAQVACVLEHLKVTFGISSYALVVSCDLAFESIVQTASKLALESSQHTFKVVASRLNKGLPYTSDQLNRAIAKTILEQSTKKVDVHQPQMMIKVECKFKQAHISVDQHRGLNGLPVRMAGRAALLLSGGFDSPVAGYLANKRGLEYIAIHFETIPFTSYQATQKVIDLAQKLSKYQNKIQLYIVNFSPIQLKINEYIPESYRTIIMRRMMIKIADKISDQHGAACLITGESLGQVASQTISSMTSVDLASQRLILRPLVSYDKVEIISLAKQIDTYDISSLPYDDCCQLFTPGSPTTNPLPHKVERFESFFDFSELIDIAATDYQSLWITPTTITKK